MVDPISDLLNRIRNAAMARHASTRIPFSKMKARIVEIMQDEGYIDGFSFEGEGIHKDIIVQIKYSTGYRTAINVMRRISTPGCRTYCGAKDIPQVKAGLGIAIVTTSKGIITDKEARRLNVGGEVLCEIW
jgi:small subunit ribosomal protein S8